MRRIIEAFRNILFCFFVLAALTGVFLYTFVWKQQDTVSLFENRNLAVKQQLEETSFSDSTFQNKLEDVLADQFVERQKIVQTKKKIDKLTAEVIYGEAIPEYIYEPTEEGYTFLGWLGEVYETMPAHDVTYTANIESGINQLPIDNGQLTIYDLMGRKVTDTENLKGGIYIINGKKTVIK